MEKYGSPINKECLSSGIIKYMQTKISCGALSDYQRMKWVVMKTANDKM